MCTPLLSSLYVTKMFDMQQAVQSYVEIFSWWFKKILRWLTVKPFQLIWPQQLQSYPKVFISNFSQISASGINWQPALSEIPEGGRLFRLLTCTVANKIFCAV